MSEFDMVVFVVGLQQLHDRKPRFRRSLYETQDSMSSAYCWSFILSAMRFLSCFWQLCGHECVYCVLEPYYVCYDNHGHVDELLFL